ncbi:ABC-2 transporter family protein [Clostridium sporogenes]|uniref:membrane-spanning permease n=1 Tax=Clostridium TaxID=1485 RepID=UPI00090B6B31|nr:MULTISPECIES: membrane-spanning permease [Clostridium]APF25353.1 ABC-2 transporter family protein [Clostridium sporogenes]MDI6918643.1 membrane-spanning permease [Clostridium botulinum]WMU98189.1 membrane-spanning permease [Clostridium botulinum]
MNILKLDFKRAFLKKSTIVTILIGLLIVFLGMFMEPIKSAIDLYYSSTLDITSKQKMDLIGNSFNKVTLWNFGQYYYEMLIPLLACIPFVSTYLEDKKSGFNKYQIIRTNYKKYIISKLIVTFISGFVVIFSISVISFFIITLISSGDNFRSIFYDGIFLERVSREHFNLFVIIYTIIVSFMGGVYASIGLSISSLIDNVLVAIIFPFTIYYFGAYFFTIIGQEKYSPDIVNKFYRYNNLSFANIALQLTLLLIISIIIFIIRTYRGDSFE